MHQILSPPYFITDTVKQGAQKIYKYTARFVKIKWIIPNIRYANETQQERGWLGCNKQNEIGREGKGTIYSSGVSNSGKLSSHKNFMNELALLMATVKSSPIHPADVYFPYQSVMDIIRGLSILNRVGIILHPPPSPPPLRSCISFIPEAFSEITLVPQFSRAILTSNCHFSVPRMTDRLFLIICTRSWQLTGKWCYWLN